MRLNKRDTASASGIMQLKYLLSFPDITYYAYPFPTGRLYIFGNKGSIKMIMFGHGFDHKNGAERYFKEGASGEMSRAVKYFDGYLLGKENPLPELDMLPFTRREIKIYDNLRKVRFGKTITYGELAEKSGMPRSARFVGTAMARNMFPVIIPCHRVIKSDGTAGEFSSGKAVKIFLLRHERAFCQ